MAKGNRNRREEEAQMAHEHMKMFNLFSNKGIGTNFTVGHY